MVSKKEVNTRLARNFHRTFKPERQYINDILKFAAEGRSGDAKSIADETGIPTGKSSGKVIPTIDYCRAMGLITTRRGNNSELKPELTDLGRVILREDPYLNTQIIQWI